MVSNIRKGTALLKVSTNSEEDFEKFRVGLQKAYKLMLVGKIIPSDEGGVHCYINVDLSSEVTESE